MEGGGVQWGGFNEDAADYPIRKFSLHFDRERRAASNKDDSRLLARSTLPYIRPRKFQFSAPRNSPIVAVSGN